MNMSIMRIIDANVNRILEGLRVLEDIARFSLNDEDIGQHFRTIRHKISIETCNLGTAPMQYRDVEKDYGADSIESRNKTNLTSLISANARRAEEGLRVLEECAKVNGLQRINPSIFKQERFNLYNIERQLTARVLRINKQSRINGLYAVVDAQYFKGLDLIKVTQSIIEGGAKLIQFRDKIGTTGNILKLASKLRKICADNDVMFIVNDHLDVTMATGADGLHLGQQDLPLSVARRYLPIDSIIGCSVETLRQAEKAKRNGADYVAAGVIFKTSTKVDAKVVGLKLIKEIDKTIDIPIVAIGGINKNNMAKVLKAGADSVAVVSALLKGRNIRNTTRELIAKIDDVRDNMPVI
jgi:thiamine-phosphate pyrophosphorylase